MLDTGTERVYIPRMNSTPAPLTLTEARADWYAACDALEFSQDSGRTKAEMRALEAACVKAYDACVAVAR